MRALLVALVLVAAVVVVDGQDTTARVRAWRVQHQQQILDELFGLLAIPNVADKPDEGLPKIAAATGGGYFELTSTNDLGATFAKVADELHHQYALGFTPEKLDGKMHALEVRLGGDAATGRTVRARKSYLAKVAGRSS